MGLSHVAATTPERIVPVAQRETIMSPSSPQLIVGLATLARRGGDLGQIVKEFAGEAPLWGFDTSPCWAGSEAAMRVLPAYSPVRVTTRIPARVRWHVGEPPPVTVAYPPGCVARSLADAGFRLGCRPEVTMIEKWDPNWGANDLAGIAGELDCAVAEGKTGTWGVCCPDSSPEAAQSFLGRAPLLCLAYSLHDQAAALIGSQAHAAGSKVWVRSPLDHGALAGTWLERQPAPDGWRAAWFGACGLQEAARRGRAVAAVAAGRGMTAAELAVRFAVTPAWVTGIVVGASTVTQFRQLAAWVAAGPLEDRLAASLATLAWPDRYGRVSTHSTLPR